MVIAQRLLNEGEHVVLSTRTHVKALFVPAAVLILLAALAGYLSSLPDGDRAGVWRLVVWGIAAALIVWFVVVPFLNWLLTTYTFTDRRLITRSGILTRSGHDVPMNRISDIAYEKGIIDRVFGSGTLVVSDASTLGMVRLHDIPHVEQAQLAISQELYRGSQSPRPQSHDDGA